MFDCQRNDMYTVNKEEKPQGSHTSKTLPRG